MNVHPYLNFDGKAEEAFTLYKSVFGGEFSANMRMKDMPDGADLPLNQQNRIMHIALPIGNDTLLMASDTVSSTEEQTIRQGNQMYITLCPDSKEEADRLFQGLSAGGEVEMPMADAFWGDYFGCFKDRFGIQWMITFNPNQSAK